ncbi:hypothetical protein ACA910_018703 [Epithemia clementina (nom. ined.)]
MTAAAVASSSLSLTGSGHLLIYQIGACVELIRSSPSLYASIQHVSGSSGGAIVATPLSIAPHRLEAYADAFIQAKGRGLALLEQELALLFLRNDKTGQIRDNQVLPTTTTTMTAKSPPFSPQAQVRLAPPQRQASSLSQQQQSHIPKLHIWATHCRTGMARSFSLDVAQLLLRNDNHNHANDCQGKWHQRMVTIIQASTRIPASFHPMDIAMKQLRPFCSTMTLTYPDHEGILLDGEYYVDGGIALPAPTLPPQDARMLLDVNDDDNKNTKGLDIVISPLTRHCRNGRLRLSPSDNTYGGGAGWWAGQQLYVAQDFGVSLWSLDNWRALRAASGLTSSAELRHWYERGQDDALQFLTQHGL